MILLGHDGHDGGDVVVDTMGMTVAQDDGNASDLDG